MGLSVELLRDIPLRFPAELVPPPGFRPSRLATWPRVDGRLEWVEGKLLYMPPSADEQAAVVTGVVLELGLWAREHPEFIVGTNEAGMLLGKAIRAADAAIWRREEAHLRGTLRRTPPILAVEVAGEEDTTSSLNTKARWYLDHGVEMVWLVFPKSRSVTVWGRARARSFRNGDKLPAPRALVGLAPRVRDMLFQLR